MPRQHGNKQSNETSATSPVIYAKCTGCHVNGELKVCEFCQYPKCSLCIETHRQADQLSQRKTMLETKINSLHQQTTLKYERLEQSTEKTAESLNLLKVTEETFQRTLKTEYAAYEEKLKQSQATNHQHINDLKHMWTEFEKMSMTNAEDCAQIDHIMDQIEATLTKTHIQICFQPNVSSPSLGSLNESLSDPIISDAVQTKDQLSNVSPKSSSSEHGIVIEMLKGDYTESNEKLINDQNVVMNENTKCEAQATDTQENNKQNKTNSYLMDCNKITTSEITEQSVNHRKMTNDILVSDEIPALTTIYHNTGKESHQRNLENFLIIWLNPNIHSIEDDKLTSLKNQLRRTVNYLRIFDQLKPCVEYINEIIDEKIFLILSSSLCQEVLPIVTDLEQIISIYILFESSINKISIKSKYQHKIAGKYGDINSVSDHLKQNVSSLSYNLFRINVLSLIEPLVYDDYNRRMESLFAAALYHLERLLSTDVWEQSNKKDLMDECRLQYAGNDDQLKLVEEFDKDYEPNKAVWWYTRNVFVTNLLNKAALVTKNDIINNLQFFVIDLHQQIEQLYSQSLLNEPTTVYFSHNLSNEELNKLKSNVNGFLLINNFFLTYTCRDAALSSVVRRVHLKPVLFQIKIDPSINATNPYAAIHSVSYSQKEEVLFSIGSVFQIKTIKKIRDGIWNVVLFLCEKEKYERLQEIKNTMKKALLTDAVGVRVTDDNKTFYQYMFINDIGKIYDKKKETFVDAIELNFGQLKNPPRMVIDIEDGQSVYKLCPSTNLLLYYCSNENIYVIDRNGNVVNQIKWIYDFIYDICWSSFLNKFIIVADSPAFSFYTYDENTNEIHRVEQQCHALRVKSFESCRCYLNIFTLGYHTSNWMLEICTFNVEEWKLIDTIWREESQIDMRFSVTTYILMGIAVRDWSKPEEESGHWRFELRDIASIGKVRRMIQLDDGMKSPCIVSLSNADWLAYDNETKLLNLVDRTVKSKKSIEYSESIKYATLMDQNCFVILTKNNQLHFHDL